MRLSSFKSLEVQGLLFDQHLGNHGHRRNVVGNLAEQLTTEAVGGRRHKTQCTCDYCPDVSRIGDCGATEFFESKAAGLSNQTFIYAGRLAKDQKFVETGRSLTYVVWHHGAATLEASTVRELEQLVSLRMLAVYAVPFFEVLAICGSLNEEPLNSRYGHSRDQYRKTYGSGYRLPMKLLLPWRVRTFLAGVQGRPLEKFL